MKSFINYRQERVKLSAGTWEHIQEVHSEIGQDQIGACLKDPDEVRRSRKNPASEIYYLLRIEKRYTCVVVKRCSDGNFISTAMTTTKPKQGEVLYKRL